MKPTEAGPSYSVSLAPGDGTILLLGSKKDFASVKGDYFSWWRRPSPPRSDAGYRLDFMPLGFYMGDQTGQTYQEAAAAMGLDIWQWLDRLLKVLKAGGANTIYVQGGGYLERNGELSAKVFAEFAGRRGFKVIVQPNDVYFGGGCYASWQKTQPNPQAGLDEFFRGHIRPRLEKYLPQYRNDRYLFAWAPTEELPPEGEEFYTAYKKLLRELDPGHLLYQYDNTLETLKHKEPPYPDLFGAGGYCWWLQDHDGRLSLWTPQYASRWRYGRIKSFADLAWKLYGRQSLCVMQGPAWFNTVDADYGVPQGWKPDKEFIPASAPVARWYPDRKLYGYYGFYLPPPNAERLSCWQSVCAGFKGMLVWAGVLYGPDKVSELIANPKSAAGDSVMIGIVHFDLTTTPQWREMADTWRRLKKLERLILALEPSETSFATTPDAHLFLNSFTDAKGRRYVIVVNGLIGQWDESSPDWLNYPRTKLTVGMDGNLTNYTALTEPRPCVIQLGEDSSVYDLRPLRRLTVEP